MIQPSHALAGLVAGGLLLAGCSGAPDPMPATSPSDSATAASSASSSPSPTSTLTAEEQQAFEEAAEAVRAYEQTFYDVLSDPEPRLNDMNNVATQPQLALDLKSLQEILSAGETTIETTGPVTVASVAPVESDLSDMAAYIVLVACVDRSKYGGTESGTAWTGRREQSQYRVVKTTYLPSPGWAVAQVLPPDGFEQPQPC